MEGRHLRRLDGYRVSFVMICTPRSFHEPIGVHDAYIGQWAPFPMFQKLPDHSQDLSQVIAKDRNAWSFSAAGVASSD